MQKSAKVKLRYIDINKGFITLQSTSSRSFASLRTLAPGPSGKTHVPTLYFQNILTLKRTNMRQRAPPQKSQGKLERVLNVAVCKWNLQRNNAKQQFPRLRRVAKDRAQHFETRSSQPFEGWQVQYN